MWWAWTEAAKERKTPSAGKDVFSMRYKMVSLGCPKNLVDSEHMAGRLDEAGHTLADEADVVIVNTCAFIADACSESIETIIEEAKGSGAGGRRLIVTGCLVERYGKELLGLLPEVDAFVGRGAYGRIEEFLDEKGYHSDGPLRGGPCDALPRRVLTPLPTAYLRIQEGCGNRCSYCTIPSIRGPLASRSVADVKEEFGRLLEGGYREINVIGQDITSFGRDTGSDLKELLTRLLTIKGDYFIRLLYLHPKGIDDQLLDLIASEDRIVKYLDIPIQHSEDRILKSMNRGYCRKDLEALFEKVRKKMADAVLRTTVMVGYPGETEGEFEGLCGFVSEQEFDALGAFMYSRETKTPAARMKGHLPRGKKKRRYQRIMELQKERSKRRLTRLMGRSMKVIVEAREAGTTTGRTMLQAPEVDGIAFIRGDCKVGEIREGVVTGTLDYDVIIELRRHDHGTHK
jgi:ribosomal protein S12 methylthiotransferase